VRLIGVLLIVEFAQVDGALLWAAGMFVVLAGEGDSEVGTHSSMYGEGGVKPSLEVRLPCHSSIVVVCVT